MRYLIQQIAFTIFILKPFFLQDVIDLFLGYGQRQKKQLVMPDPNSLDNYNSDAYTQLAANLCLKVLPSIMLLGHTDVGCDLAPRLNGRLGGGLAMDCLALSVDPATKLLVSTRPVFGGNAHARVVSRSARPQMATLRPKIVPPAERNDSRQGKVIPVEGKIDPSALKVRRCEKINLYVCISPGRVRI